MKSVSITVLALVVAGAVIFAVEKATRPSSSPNPSQSRKADEPLKLSAVARKVGDAWTHSLGMKFVFIPSGEFEMGSAVAEVNRDSNESQHHVKLRRAFLMATTHLTRGQFADFVKDSRYKTDAEKVGRASAWTVDNTLFSGRVSRRPGNVGRTFR